MANSNASVATNSASNFQNNGSNDSKNISSKLTSKSEAIIDNNSTNKDFRLLRQSPEKFLSKEADIAHTSNCLKAMAHPLRLKILCLLSKFEQISVLDLVESVGTSQSNISQHLSILREKGLLICNKEANKVYYELADQDLGDLIHSIRKAFCNKELSS